ncbi:MAG TPA: hypothetical protein VLA40_08295, partial [Rheinheimera sp.]|nr:hypothetical protein [Rheinheimera sp.]
MARKALVTFDFPSAPTVGGASTWYVTPTGTNASGTWGISVTGNAGTVTNGVYTTGNQTIGGTKTFSSTISGSVSGNAGTATTLQTARNINGTSFNGSANITVAEPTFSGQLSVYVQTDANTFTGGLTARYLSSGATNKPTGTDHALLTMAYSADWAVQLAGDWRTNTWYSRTEQSGTWGSWVTMLSSANYNSFAPTLTGTGASGTWGISITGSSATLTTARTLTIGSTGKTFNGSADVSWTLGEIGAQGALTLTTTGTSGVATLVGNTLNIPNYATGGSGTVTSVGLSLPTFITVTGSPVTTSGTLTGTLASQTANTVFVAPNGTAGAPTFRALVEADIPTLSQAKITNLTTDLAAKAPLASPAFTGTPSLPTGTTGVTQTAGNSTTALATTAFVTTANNLKANLASPALTGTPTAPTAAVGTNTTQLATTAFVNAEIANDAVLLTGNQTVAGNKTFSGTTALAAGSTIDGFVVGYRDVPVLISNAARTFALADAGEAFGKDNATAYTYTIPANASVAFPIGTVITVFNNNATSNITIAITTDTLRLAGTTTTGSRTVP